MGRWFLVFGCLFVLGSLAYSDATRARATDARTLGGSCQSTHECKAGTSCIELEGVLRGQCSVNCNSSAACQAQFGAASLCLGADVCARTCDAAADCPENTACNAYGWCERVASGD
jgi:hypothetical protein